MAVGTNEQEYLPLHHRQLRYENRLKSQVLREEIGCDCGIQWTVGDKRYIFIYGQSIIQWKSEDSGFPGACLRFEKFGISIVHTYLGSNDN